VKRVAAAALVLAAVGVAVHLTTRPSADIELLGASDTRTWRDAPPVDSGAGEILTSRATPRRP
jgi:hypothetical protein